MESYGIIIANLLHLFTTAIRIGSSKSVVITAVVGRVRRRWPEEGLGHWLSGATPEAVSEGNASKPVPDVSVDREPRDEVLGVSALVVGGEGAVGEGAALLLAHRVDEGRERVVAVEGLVQAGVGKVTGRSLQGL
jgi:hypothetical protein